MTSQSKIKRSCWACGLYVNSVIEQLGRIAVLEYTIPEELSQQIPHSRRHRQNSNPQKPPTPPSPPPPPSTSPQDQAATMPIPRIAIPQPAALKPVLPRTTPASLRSLSTSSPSLAGWTGRTPDEHAVNRTDEKDVESKPAHQGMREKGKDDSHSFGISEKGGDNNRKAEQDKPEAPKPVIGMNDERGERGH